MRDLLVEKSMGTPMIDMVSVEQREQHVDIEQCPHAGSSSSRRSISSLDTAGPRRGKGANP